MRCLQAGGYASWHDETVTLERQGATFVFKDVPAQVCPNCGEDYVDEAVASELLQSAEGMGAAGTQVDIRHYPITVYATVRRR